VVLGVWLAVEEDPMSLKSYLAICPVQLQYVDRVHYRQQSLQEQEKVSLPVFRLGLVSGFREMSCRDSGEYPELSAFTSFTLESQHVHTLVFTRGEHWLCLCLCPKDIHDHHQLFLKRTKEDQEMEFLSFSSTLSTSSVCHSDGIPVNRRREAGVVVRSNTS